MFILRSEEPGNEANDTPGLTHTGPVPTQYFVTSSEVDGDLGMGPGMCTISLIPETFIIDCCDFQLPYMVCKQPQPKLELHAGMNDSCTL